MNHFSFELESAVVPATLKIEVSYYPYYEESTYDHDSIFEVSNKSYNIYLEKLDITQAIDNSNYRELQDEIASAVDNEISNHFFNL